MSRILIWQLFHEHSIQLFNGGGCNSSKYLAGGNGNDQVNYCNHIHQITVLLPNHTFHEEIEHNLVCPSLWTLQQKQHHSQTTILNHMINFSQSGNFLKGHTGSVQIVKLLPVNSSLRMQQVGISQKILTNGQKYYLPDFY